MQTLAREAGVPVAAVVRVVGPTDGLGPGYVMERIEGEVLAPRILREDRFAEARRVLARQCGEAAARIHAGDLGYPLGPAPLEAPALIELYRRRYDSFGDPHPVFEWALRWLAQRLPPAVEPRLVRGDFRLGNLIVGPEGLRAVLDWEVAHLGDPMEDLGTICVPSWRFGGPHPVGGFGSRKVLSSPTSRRAAARSIRRRCGGGRSSAACAGGSTVRVWLSRTCSVTSGRWSRRRSDGVRPRPKRTCSSDPGGGRRRSLVAVLTARGGATTLRRCVTFYDDPYHAAASRPRHRHA